MEFVMEEIDIKYEYDIYDLDLDHDIGSSSHCTDWKLNSNVECRVTLERLKSLDSEKEVQRDPNENGEAEPEKCSEQIHQLQQHLLLTHGNIRGGDHENNSIETTVSASEPVPVSLDPNHVPSEKKILGVNISHGDVDKNSGGEFVPSLTIGSKTEGEPISCKVSLNNTNRKSIPKGGKSQPYKCVTCQMTFLTFYELTQHKTIHTKERQVTQYIRVNTVLTPPSSNQQELSTGCQKQQFKCDLRLKGYHNSSKLIRHKRTHTGEKPYKCDVCGKCFTQNGTLNRHKLSHNGEKQHWCELCGKCFTQLNDLVRHKLVHTGEKPFECIVCGKCFGQSGNLTHHKLTHTGEKPHRCNLCGKYFRVRSHLTRHKLVHTGEKPYKCDVCGKCFRQNGTLTQHKLIHTGVKSHKCEKCGKCFTHNSYLIKHARTHTGEKQH